jgi:hypothetical protein
VLLGGSLVSFSRVKCVPHVSALTALTLLLTLLVLTTLLVLPLEVRPTVYTLLAVGRELIPRLLEGGCWLALLFAALWVDAGQRCVELER